MSAMEVKSRPLEEVVGVLAHMLLCEKPSEMNEIKGRTGRARLILQLQCVSWS